MTRRLLPWILLCSACAAPTPAAAESGAGKDLHVQVVRLEHTQAADVVAVVGEVLGERPAVGKELKIVAAADHNAVVLSGTQQQIRDAQELIARLDVKPAR